MLWRGSLTERRLHYALLAMVVAESPACPRATLALTNARVRLRDARDGLHGGTTRGQAQAHFAIMRLPAICGRPSIAASRGLRDERGKSCSPVSASSTVIALTGQFSAASRLFSSLSPEGSTASDCRSSLSRKTFGANVSHIALPTQVLWSTRMRRLRAIAAS